MEPCAPQDLAITDITSETITLSWQAPESDGGAPITNYIIVMREASKKKFKKVGKVDAKTLCFTINSDLRENEEYALRVYAENEQGVSESAAELQSLVKIPSSIKAEIEAEVTVTSEESKVSQKVKTKEDEAPVEETSTSKKVKGKGKEAVNEEVKVEGEVKVKEEAPSDVKEEVMLLFCVE